MSTKEGRRKTRRGRKQRRQRPSTATPNETLFVELEEEFIPNDDLAVQGFGQIVSGALYEILDLLNQGSEALNSQGFSPKLIERANAAFSRAIKRTESLIFDTQMGTSPFAEAIIDGSYGVLDNLESVGRVLGNLEPEFGRTNSVYERLSDAAIVIESLLVTSQAEYYREADLEES